MKLAITTLIFLLIPSLLFAAPSSRYFYTGDGKISLSSKSGGSFTGFYRKGDSTYNEAAIRAINRVFGAKYGDPANGLSPRLIEFLDYLSDELGHGGHITIASGFRNPTYNTKLRESGKLAAKASLHQYAMACDMKIAGVDSNRVWNYVKDLGFGGAGFYHGALVHVDVGPARSWDEETSGVGTDISDDNKLITIVADRDIYLAGEPVEMRFTRMTAFPIGVAATFELLQQKDKDTWKTVAKFSPKFLLSSNDMCPAFQNIAEMAGIKWALPPDLPGGRYKIRASFCNKEWEKMPDSISTPEFEIRKN